MSDELMGMLYRELLRALSGQLVPGAENSILLRLKVKAWIRDVFDAAVSELLPIPPLGDDDLVVLPPPMMPPEDDGADRLPPPSVN